MKHILIIKPSSMGDVVHAFPAVHALLTADSEYSVDWVIHPAFAELLDYLPGIRRKILFRRGELGKLNTCIPALRELLRELRRERYDAVIDLQGLFRSALTGLMARGGCLYGPADAREFPARMCYRRKLRFPEKHAHAVEKNCAMIREFAGLAEISPEYHLPEVSVYSAAAEKLLNQAGLQGKKWIALAPGARWKTKQWPPEFFADCAGKIAERLPDLRFALLGSPAEQSLCSRVRDAASSAGMQLVDLCGKTSSGELVEVIRRASLLLCNDSGPMHLAAAVETPVAALFGPTDPILTGPHGRNCRVIQPELDCIKCLRKRCETEKCHNVVSPFRAAEQVCELLESGEERK
ncbi:MAG: lipopolysaccharide heptosyltransferase II [Lentisphaeria bacterium]|nr:lipopolysaccharide heptosyltransferase II [Lentisphaeria bacterium]